MHKVAAEIHTAREQLQAEAIRVDVNFDALQVKFEEVAQRLKEVRRSCAQVDKRVTERKKHEELWNNLAEIQQKYKAVIQSSLEYHIRNKQRGRVRVAMIPHYKDLGLPLPVTYGFVNVLISPTRVLKALNFMDPINLADELSPDRLHDSRGRLYTNLISFSYCYAKTKPQKQINGWEWPSNTHIDSNEDITEKYFIWRKAGSSRAYPVHHPAGNSSCVTYTPPEFCFWPAALQGDAEHVREIDNPAIDYYNFERTGPIRMRPGWETYARVEYPLYTYLARQTAGYRQLAEMIAAGKNVQLLCYDAPDVLFSANCRPAPPFDKVLPGICGENGAKSLEIDRDTIMSIRSLDLEHMSHGYSLAIALLEGTEWLSIKR